MAINRSLIGDTSGSGINAATGTDNILDQAALLGPLADNGGPTQTHALLEGSPAIDAGNNALAVDENGIPLTTDQRGEARIQSGTVDIGAVEFGDSFLLGDVNRDGVVNFLDIVPFINLITTDTFLDEADVNGSGAVDFLDIVPFIAILTGGDSSTATSESIVVAAPVSATASLVTTAEPKWITTSASTVELPVATVSSLAKTVAAKPAPFIPNIARIKPNPQVPLVLVNASTVSAVAETGEPVEAAKIVQASSVDTATPWDSYVGPGKYSLLEDLTSSLRAVEGNGPLMTRRSLPRSADQIDSFYEMRKQNPVTNAWTENSFSTAAELFDAHPETLDEVFEFQFEETLAGLI